MAAPTGSIPASTLAGLFDVDERTIRKLAADGIVVKGSRRGEYQLGASIKAYVTHLREQAAGRLGRDEAIDPAKENALLRREQRENYRLKNAILAGSAVEIDAIEPGWARVVRAVRSAMLAVPGKVRMQLPTLTNHDGQVIEEIIRQQLTDAALADDPPQIKD